MHPNEINENLMETFWKEPPSYSTVKKWTAEFKRGRERELMMMDGVAAPKMTMSRSCTPWLSVIGGETYEA